MIAKVATVALVGFDGAIVEVETDIKQGLPAIHIVGMGNKAIEEARERVRSALRNSLLDLPARKVIVNLAPAELPKHGAQYDLPIALSILVASGQLQHTEVAQALFAGELSLSGELRPIRGSVTIAEAAKKAGFKHVFIPQDNYAQASLVRGIEVIGVKSLQELFLHLKKEKIIVPIEPVKISQPFPESEITIDTIYGHEQAKRVLQIAAAGRHNILLIGSPGAGKTLLAKSLISLLPPLTHEERLEVTRVHSIAGERESIIDSRPFRSPHHTTSTIALIGGGVHPKPGEISLAHLGVLFLDELPEYSRQTLESLRQPLEDKAVTLVRSQGRITYPADFMLVATMNPCPCGYYGDSEKECTCSAAQINTYQRKLSGPLLDRIDLILHVKKANQSDFLIKKSLNKNQHSKVFEHILSAVKIQKVVHKSSKKYNANLSPKDIEIHVKMAAEATKLLFTAAKNLGLTTRAYFKTIKVAQTIADLEMSPQSPLLSKTNAKHHIIQPAHVAEALQYREGL